MYIRQTNCLEIVYIFWGSNPAYLMNRYFKIDNQYMINWSNYETLKINHVHIWSY